MFEFLNINSNEHQFINNVLKVDVTLDDGSTVTFENDNYKASKLLFKDNWVSAKFNDQTSLSGRIFTLISSES
ncbi:putative anti-sigma factor [Fructobacillus fructosus]|nr:putative anti-sigma factor [Fructobacillus fructosus]